MGTDKFLDATQHAASQGMIPPHGLTEAVHIGESDLPFVDLGDGSLLQLLQVDLNQGLWVVRTKFPPGYQVNKHYHTGPVFAVTLEGCWFYKEYPDYQNTKGSYLYEPAHSVHTLMVSDEITEMTDVWFAIYGANVNVDENNDVIGVTDAQSILGAYQSLCAAQGLDCTKVIIKQWPQLQRLGQAWKPCFFRNGKILVEDQPMPVPGAGQVLVKSRSCGICGCGPIGLATILALKKIGIETIIASDPTAKRWDLALQMGAIAAVDPSNSDVMDVINQHGPDKQVIFECVGIHTMVPELMEAAPPRSTIVFAGVHTKETTFKPVIGMVKELDIKFTFYYESSEFEEALNYLTSGELTWQPLVTGTVGYDGRTVF